MRLRILAFLTFFLAAFVTPANAAVTITFYSHEFRLIASGLTTYFPHGFVTLNGSDASGAPVSANFGFSARNFLPNVLWWSVEGTLDETPLPNGYVEESHPHFSFTLSEEQYRAVLTVAESWRSWPQPSYNIDRHNCVHFVREMAVAAGLAVADDAAFEPFVREPEEFLDDVAARNAAFLSGGMPAMAVPVPTLSAPAAPAMATGGAEALKRRLEELEAERARAN